MSNKCDLKDVHFEHTDEHETNLSKSMIINALAGALAGCTEYFVMFPLDSIKTRMQMLASDHKAYKGTWSTAYSMVKNEGFTSLYRGLSTVPIGAGASHAIYFTAYETAKLIMSPNPERSAAYNVMASSFAGASSALVTDAVRTPADTVKQRLQMENSPYKSVTECIKSIYGKDGVAGFYRSYTTQVFMNIPRQCIYMTLYEYMKYVTNPSGRYNIGSHITSSAVAGSVAVAVTTPLDVCKTLLNTQETKALSTVEGGKVRGVIQALGVVYKIGGVSAFFKGIVPRILFQMPSTAICWSTYEFYKYAFGSPQSRSNYLQKAKK